MTIQLIHDRAGKSHLRWDSQSADTAKLLSLLQDAARGLYLKGVFPILDGNGEPLDVDTLTNAQLGQVLDAYYKMTTLAEARAYFVVKAAQDAQATAETEADTRYNGG